jgi:hypothetical protein
MIDPSELVFPGNVIELMAASFEIVDPDIMIFKRPLRPSDPNMSIGIWGSLWTPEEDSLEIGHSYPGEPTLSSYQIMIQALIKDGDEVRGLAIHSILSKRIRSVLYRNGALHVALQSLNVSDDLSTERARRWGVRTQRYMNNDIEGTFVYLSTLEYWVETEMS